MFKLKSEVTLFSKANFSFSFNPFLMTQGIAVFALILFSLFAIGNLFVASPQIADSQIIKKISVKQVSAGIANSQPIKWTILVKRSDINSSQNLVQLPKTAKSIKVKSISEKNAKNILAKTVPQAGAQLTAEERQKLSAALNPSSSFFTASLFSKFSKFFLASVEDAIDQLIEKITQEVIIADDVKLVDLSDDAEPEVAAENKEEKQEEKEEKQEETAAITPDVFTPTSGVADAEPGVAAETKTSGVDVKTPEVAAEIEDEFIQIDYETPAPTIAEQNTDTGKIVTISDSSAGPNHPQLTNVLVYINIPEIYKTGQESKIEIKWKNNNNQQMEFYAHDLNGNDKIDYIEWIVPYLSEQIFEIIFTSKAFKLGQDKNIIEDIYDQVYSQDNIWATVENNQHVRVAFEQSLDSAKNIIVYARSSCSDECLTLNVKQENEIELVASFPIIPTIDRENVYKIHLTGLQNPTDVLDLKITGGNIDIDYIAEEIDPPVVPADNLSGGGGGGSWVSFNPIEPVSANPEIIEPIAETEKNVLEQSDIPEQVIQQKQNKIDIPAPKTKKQIAPPSTVEKPALEKTLEPSGRKNNDANIQSAPKNWLAKILWKEIQELNLMMAAIIKKLWNF